MSGSRKRSSATVTVSDAAAPPTLPAPEVMARSYEDWLKFSSNLEATLRRGAAKWQFHMVEAPRREREQRPALSTETQAKRKKRACDSNEWIHCTLSGGHKGKGLHVELLCCSGCSHHTCDIHDGVWYRLIGTDVVCCSDFFSELPIDLTDPECAHDMDWISQATPARPRTNWN